MSLRKKLSDVRAVLQDARSDLHGVQLETTSEPAAADLASARAALDQAIGLCTEALRHQLERTAS